MNIDRYRGRISGTFDTPLDQTGFGQSRGGVRGRGSTKSEAGATDNRLICAARCFLRRVGS